MRDDGAGLIHAVGKRRHQEDKGRTTIRFDSLRFDSIRVQNTSRAASTRPTPVFGPEKKLQRCSLPKPISQGTYHTAFFAVESAMTRWDRGPVVRGWGCLHDEVGIVLFVFVVFEVGHSICCVSVIYFVVLLFSQKVSSTFLLLVTTVKESRCFRTTSFAR